MLLALPQGIDQGLRRRPVVSIAIGVVIAWRLFLNLIFPATGVRILAYAESETITFEVVSAFLQSMVTPLLAAGMAAEHQLFAILAFALIIMFWIYLGPGLEDRLGRWQTLAIFGVGAGLSMGVAMYDGFELSEVFWLGHGATLFAAGYCLFAFATADVRLRVFYWTPFGGSGGAEVSLPSLFVLLPMICLMMPAQSVIWYEDAVRYNLPARFGGLSPAAWQFLLAAAGLASAWVAAETGKYLGKKVPAAA